jgi:hypothetical protein
MSIREYDTVLLKDGREACVVEVLSPTSFIVDVGDGPEDWNTVSVTSEDVERVLN